MQMAEIHKTKQKNKKTKQPTNQETNKQKNNKKKPRLEVSESQVILSNSKENYGKHDIIAPNLKLHPNEERTTDFTN